MGVDTFGYNLDGKVNTGQRQYDSIFCLVKLEDSRKSQVFIAAVQGIDDFASIFSDGVKVSVELKFQ